MRKIFLMSSVLFVAPFVFGESGEVSAQCVATQDCASLGYTEASCPNGGIKCPFGNTWNCKGDGAEEPEIPTCAGNQSYDETFKACVCQYVDECRIGGFEETACTDTVWGKRYEACKYPYYYLYSDYTYSLKEQPSKGKLIGIIMGMSETGSSGYIPLPDKSDYIIALDFKKNLTKQEALDYCANYSQPGLEAGKWSPTHDGTTYFLHYHDRLGTPYQDLRDFGSLSFTSSEEWRETSLYNHETGGRGVSGTTKLSIVCSIKLEDSGILDKLQEI